MTLFIVFCIVMAAVAIALVLWPLLRNAPPTEDAVTPSPQPARIAAIATGVVLPVLAVWLYTTVSTWQWDYVPPAAGAVSPEVERAITQLEERLKQDPQDVEGWVMLGRAFVMMGQYPSAVDAFEQAYDHSQGENLAAITGLAEALVLTDETELEGRAGELIERALTKAPREPRALWYGSLAAVASGRFDVARDRMLLLLEQNPPEQIRSLLETQIADIEAQIGSASAPTSEVSVNVAVSIAPEITAQMGEPRTLFVLARDATGGPPLAVVRLSSDELPKTIELADGNAMIAGRGLSSVSRAEIVARLSSSGNPQAQSGDFYGTADYVVQPGRGSVNIVIDRVVP